MEDIQKHICRKKKHYHKSKNNVTNISTNKESKTYIATNYNTIEISKCILVYKI